jgi:hypothetical protein
VARLHLLLIVLIATLALGCGDDSSEPSIDAGPVGDGDGDGDGDRDGDASAGDGDGDGDGDFMGAECGGPEPDGRAVTVEIAESGATPPAANGGELRSGTYDLISVTYFDPAATCVVPATISDTLTIDATHGTATETFVYTYSDGFIERFAFAYEISSEGMVSTWDVVCPEPPSSSDQAYTASEDMLVLTIGEGDCSSAWTFERR